MPAKAPLINEPALSRELLTTLLNNSDAAIIYYTCVRNKEGKIIDFLYQFINETAFRVIRRLKPENIGTLMLSHYRKDDDFSWLEIWIKVVETGEVTNYILNRIEDGQNRWFRNKLVRCGDGLILYFYDETDKVKLSEQLEEKNIQLMHLLEKKEGIFSEVLNQAFDGVLYLTPLWNDNKELNDFRIVFANDSALKTLKMSYQDIYPFSFLQVFPNAIENGTFQMYKEAYEQGTSSRKQVRYDDGRIGGWYIVDTFRYEEGVIIYFRDETPSVEHEIKIEKQNKELQTVLRQKELLLQETHHRVKNNMQIVASLLNLQSRTIDDPRTLDAFQVSVQRIQTMALIHEKLYSENNFEKIQFEGFVSDIITSIKGFFNPARDIFIRYSIEDVNLPISICINLGLVLNELLSNSIKHAFINRDKGEISIHSKLKGRSFDLSISDNGQGLPHNIDLENLPTLGLTIVRVLIEQMDGSLYIENNHGASFHISIPVNT